MIINNVKLSRNIFLKQEVVLETNNKKISLGELWEQEIVNKLNKQLMDFKIETYQDFIKLKDKLKWLDNEKYKLLETKLINSIPKFWKFFNPGIRGVPRPMIRVWEKVTGIKEFFVFSLNARDFEAALNANRHIIDNLKNKNLQDLEEEKILMKIREAIDEEHALVDFEIRIGLIFNNFEKGKYQYKNKNLNKEEQLEFVKKLINNYGVCYVENPFSEKDLDSYEKLRELRSKSLICINSKINNYDKAIDKDAFNTVITKFNDMKNFIVDVNHFKDNNLRIISEVGNDSADVIVGMEIPLVKIEDNKLGNIAAKRIVQIQNEIKEEINNDKINDGYKPRDN